MYIDEEKLIFCFDEIFNSIPVDDIKIAVNCNRSNFKTEYETVLRMNKEDGQFLLKKYGPKMIELSKDKNYWVNHPHSHSLRSLRSGGLLLSSGANDFKSPTFSGRSSQNELM